MRLVRTMQIGLEFGIRKLFTDYLDDVSTTYIDKNILLAERCAKAVELAFRSVELTPGAQYPPDGTQRGSPKNKDWYYCMGITFSFTIIELHKQNMPRLIGY